MTIEVNGSPISEVYVGSTPATLYLDGVEIWPGNLPPAYDAVSAGAWGANWLNCTMSATAGALVVVDFTTDRAAVPSSVTYGGIPMIQVAAVGFNGLAAGSNPTLFRYALPNVPSGSQTVALSGSGNPWVMVSATSYTNVGSLGGSGTATGNAASLSHGPIALLRRRKVVHAFGRTGNAALTSLAGGTNRFNQSFNVGAMSISESSTSGVTFSAAGGSTSPWAGISTILNPVPLGGSFFGFGGVGPGASVHNSTPPSLSFAAPIGADVYAVLATDRNGTTSLTGATYGGSAMSHVATVYPNNNASLGAIKVYRLAGAGDGTSKTVAGLGTGNDRRITNAFAWLGGTVGTPTTATGSGTAPSQSVSGTGIWILGGGAGSSLSVGTMSAFTGVVNHSNNNLSNAVSQSVSVVSGAGTAGATFSGSTTWGSIFIPITNE